MSESVTTIESPESTLTVEGDTEHTLTPELSYEAVEAAFADIIEQIDNQITPEAEEALTQVEMSKRGGSKQLFLMSAWYGGE